MAERSVSVRLLALTQQYDAAMKKSGRETEDLGTKAQLTGKEIDGVGTKSRRTSRDVDNLGTSMRNAAKEARQALPSWTAVAGVTALAASPAMVGGVLALGAAFTGAGTAALGAGIVAKSAFSEAQKAAQKLASAQETVNNSTNPQARKLALEKQAALIKQLGPDVIALAQATKDLSTQWHDFANSFTPELTEGVSEISKLGKDVLPQLQPLISGTFGVFAQIIGQIDKAASGQGGQQFIKWLATEGPRDLMQLADAAGNVAAGMGHLAMAMSPLTHDFLGGLDSITAKFNNWSSTLGSNTGFQHFMDTVEKDGPMVVRTIGDVARALGEIGMGLSPVLRLELSFIDQLAKIIADHPKIAEALAAMYLGFKALAIISPIAKAAKDFALAEDAMALSAGRASGALGKGGLLGSLISLGRFLAANPEVAVAIGVAVGGAYVAGHVGPQPSESTQQYVASQLKPEFRQDFLNNPGADMRKQIPTANGWTYEPSTNIDGYNVPNRMLLSTSTVGVGGVSRNGDFNSQIPRSAFGPTRQGDFNSQVPGGPTSNFGRPGGPDYFSEFTAGLNNPSDMLPFSSGVMTAQDIAKAQDDFLHAQALAAIDPTNKLALAQENVTDAVRRLNNETKVGTLEYYQDLQNLHQAQADLAAEQKAEADARAQAVKQLADDQAAYNDLLNQESQTQQKFDADMAAAAKEHADNDAKLISDRIDQITGFASASVKAATQWGSSLSFLTTNVNSQVDQITQWAQALADARKRGVSEGVIKALGLDQGPQALNQLKQFSNATQDQIDALNKAVAAKNKAAGDEANTEAVNHFGQLGQDLISEQQRYADAVKQLQTQFISDMQQLAKEAQQMQDQITQDQKTVNALPPQYVAVGTNAHPGWQPGAALYIKEPNGTFYHLSPGQLSAQGPNVPIYQKMYDSGGYLNPGFTVAYNGTGRPEPVFTQEQLATLMGGSAPQVRVFIGDEEITSRIRVEIGKVNSAKRQAIQVGGVR